MADINKMTRKEFEALPFRPDGLNNFECSGIVILPTKRIHDSGYRCMDFIAVDEEGQPMCRLSGCSDIIHVDGIGGQGQFDSATRTWNMPEPSGWSIDCLKTSGLLHMWPRSRKTIAGASLSSFELFAGLRER